MPAIIINYSTDEEPDRPVSESILAILNNTLPYMVDNVDIQFLTDEDL